MEVKHSLLGETTLFDQPKSRKTRHHMAPSEEDLRNAVEAWGRRRWPEARICHELTMDRGTVRLDIAFIMPNRLIVAELKSGYDTMSRGLHQIGMASLGSDEVWLICDPRFTEDMNMLRYLLPHVGVAAIIRDANGDRIKVMNEPGVWKPYPEAMSALLWVEELKAALGIPSEKNIRHNKLVAQMSELDDEQRHILVCRALRQRKTLWRSDPPVLDDN